MSRQKNPHRPVQVRCLPRPYCIKCGLLYLNNQATAAAIKAACPGDKDEEGKS